jgi:uncharacterized protein YjiS (DUF1127 family)
MVAIINDVLRNSQLERRAYRRAGLHELTLLIGRLGVLAGRALARWHRNAVEKRELAQLSERDLHDIGLTPADVRVALDKPFWRA